jgi:hypothetical protein
MANRQEEEFIAEDLLPLAIEYCDSPAFTTKIEEFQTENASRFRRASESKSSEATEIPHDYHTMFVEYQDLVEKLLERFAESNGFTIKGLYRCFRDAGTVLQH